uniref:C2H2-type domain-containing protein n=1 Tax=Panagrellus redivivus TaxID=6233 RepID=A0A7E4VRC1_PANRE
MLPVAMNGFPDGETEGVSYALVKIVSTEDLSNWYLQLNDGFNEVVFLKKVPENGFMQHEEYNALTKLNGSTVSKQKTVGKRKIVREAPPEENDLPKIVIDEATLGQDPLTAAVFAALSSVSCLMNGVATASNTEESDDQRATSSTTTNSHDSPSPADTATIPSPLPFVARPRGARAQLTNDDPTVYASCKLCSNKIMSSRLSNLTNHVRRHAALKQYQCCHCSYSHNEMAKVRLHMQHNHKDGDSTPIDGMCKEMQLQWSNLMEQCFPGHAKRFAHNNSFVAIHDDAVESPKVSERAPSILSEAVTENKPEETESITEATDFSSVSPSETFTCSECGEFVQSARLLTHLVETHTDECHSFACAECNFLANAPWKVILHINNEHDEKPCDSSVVMTPSGTNYIISVPLFFPEFAQRRGCSAKDDILHHEYVTKCAAHLQHDLNVLKAVQCELCFKLFTADQNISVLLNHARNHFGIKAFSCPACNFEAPETYTVVAHITEEHRNCQNTPVDCSIDRHKAAWRKLACLCFPSLVDSLNEALAGSQKHKYKRHAPFPVERQKKKQIIIAANAT